MTPYKHPNVEKNVKSGAMVLLILATLGVAVWQVILLFGE